MKATKGGRYNDRRHKPLAHNSSSYNGGLAGGNLLASIGINPVPSFAIRSKVTNLSFGAIGADQNNAPAAIVLTARRICGFEVRVVVHIGKYAPLCRSGKVKFVGPMMVSSPLSNHYAEIPRLWTLGEFAVKITAPR